MHTLAEVSMILGYSFMIGGSAAAGGWVGWIAAGLGMGMLVLSLLVMENTRKEVEGYDYSEDSDAAGEV